VDRGVRDQVAKGFDGKRGAERHFLGMLLRAVVHARLDAGRGALDEARDRAGVIADVRDHVRA
jgi:hypothetical protein